MYITYKYLITLNSLTYGVVKMSIFLLSLSLYVYKTETENKQCNKIYYNILKGFARNQ